MVEHMNKRSKLKQILSLHYLLSVIACDNFHRAFNDFLTIGVSFHPWSMKKTGNTHFRHNDPLQDRENSMEFFKRGGDSP